MKVMKVIEERAKVYGNWKTYAELSQSIKGVFKQTDGWSRLSSGQKEALSLIAVKISRILNGDPDFADNWVDIAGYAELGIVKEETTGSVTLTYKPV